MQHNTQEARTRATLSSLRRFSSKFSAVGTPEKPNRNVLRNALLCSFDSCYAACACGKKTIGVGFWWPCRGQSFGGMLEVSRDAAAAGEKQLGRYAAEQSKNYRLYLKSDKLREWLAKKLNLDYLT
jgi:hypothetical protein